MPAEPIESLLSRLDPQLHQRSCRFICPTIDLNADDLICELSKELKLKPPPGDDTEVYVVELFDRLVLKQIVLELKPRLRQRASRSTCREVAQSADDFIHDLYLRLTKHPPPVGGNAESYAVESFKNLVKDCERSCNRRTARDVEFMQAKPETCPDDVDLRAIQRDQRLHLKRAARLANLRSDFRCALWASMRDSLDEFARRRGIPRKTAGVWAYRARQAMLPHLEHLRGDFAY